MSQYIIEYSLTPDVIMVNTCCLLYPLTQRVLHITKTLKIALTRYIYCSGLDIRVPGYPGSMDITRFTKLQVPVMD